MTGVNVAYFELLGARRARAHTRARTHTHQDILATLKSDNIVETFFFAINDE